MNTPFIHYRRLELVECLDGLAGTGQDTQDVEADLLDYKLDRIDTEGGLTTAP